MNENDEEWKEKSLATVIRRGNYYTGLNWAAVERVAGKYRGLVDFGVLDNFSLEI
jgi:hypothetical protein